MSDITYHSDKQSVSKKKYVSGSEPFVMGHYPSNAIFPGVLLLDLMMETARALVEKIHQKSSRVSRIKRIQFLEIVKPGDILNINASLKKGLESGCLIDCAIYAGDSQKVRGTMEVTFTEQTT